MKTKKALLYLILATGSFQVTNNIFSDCVGGCGEIDGQCVKAHVCEDCKTLLKHKGNDIECKNKKNCCKKDCSKCTTKKNNCWAQTKEKGNKKDDYKKHNSKKNGKHSKKSNGGTRKKKKTDNSK